LLQMKYKGIPVRKISKMIQVPPDKIQRKIIMLEAYRHRSGIF